MARGASLLMAVALLAGCLAPEPAGPAVANTGLDLTQQAERFAGERPVVASTTLHEEVDGALVDRPFANGDEPWGPRDFELTYHGIQEVYDAFARRVPGQVFRFTMMVFIQDSVTIGQGGIDVDGHYEEHLFEVVFGLDGRMISASDLQGFFSMFSPPWLHSPFGDPLAAIAFKVFQANGLSEIQVYDYEGERLFYSFERYEGEPPMAGNCQAWTMTARVDPLPPPPPPLVDVSLQDPPEERRTLVCIAEGDELPLWVWSGTSDASSRVLRTGGSFSTPPFNGEALLPVAYRPMPWQEVRGPLDLAGPLMVPPASDGGTWAEEVSARAAALYFSPGYVQYRLASDLPYVDFAWLGIPIGLPILNITLPNLPILGQRSQSLSWLTLTDGSARHSHFLTTYDSEPEGPEFHVAEPQGSNRQESRPVMPAMDLPPLVGDGELQGQLSPLLPEKPEMLLFWFLAFDDDEDGDFQVYPQWQALQDCTATEDGWFASIEAEAGWVEFMAKLPGGTSECGELSGSWQEAGRPPAPAAFGFPGFGLIGAGPHAQAALDRLANGPALGQVG